MEIHSLEQLQSGKHTHVTRITISNKLRAFPPEIFQFTESLEVLDLSNNLLTEVPEAILSLKKLKILFLSNNRFTEFPLLLGQCQSLSMIGFKSNQIHVIPEHAFPETLQWLILTDNRIEQLPSSIGKCLLLQKVALAGNQLTQLPAEMANCKTLGLLRISANQIKELPQWLLSMPKLAWLAYSGNPCTERLPAPRQLPLVNWEDLTIMDKLGEGASGVISKAIAKPGIFGTENYEVAIKVFKGEVTSDGYPEDEMAITTHIPKHRHLVPVLAKINGHPEKKEGLIFELIPTSYHNLGMPPSFSTCTRDTFKQGTKFTIPSILKIVSAIANAALLLHSNGIMHGDLYAHNTLINNEANTLFSDFGAATYYRQDSLQAPYLERLEVRAFGYLLEDLLLNAETSQEYDVLNYSLVELKTHCLQENVLQRPDFSGIIKQLSQLLKQYNLLS